MFSQRLGTLAEADYGIHHVTICEQTPDTTQFVASNAKFPLFARLPVELRLDIFGASMPGPRIIEFMRHDRYQTNNQKSSPEVITPTLLSVNQESRALALSRFTPCFEHYTCNHRPIWMDFENDTLLLTVRRSWRFLDGSPSMPGSLSSRTYLMEVRNIAFTERPFEAFWGLERFGGLRRITFLKASFPWSAEVVELAQVGRLKAGWRREAADEGSKVMNGDLDVLQLTREEFMEGLRWDGRCDM